MEEIRSVPFGRVTKYGDGQKVIYMITRPTNQLRYDGTEGDDIRVLICAFNALQKIYDLPKNLVSLNLLNNRIEHIEEIPESLKNLTLDYNLLETLPNIKNVRKLAVSHNRLRSIPDLWDSNITSLQIENNFLTELPCLPKNLRVLRVDGNMLEKLPPLPKSLVILSCRGNRIKHLSIEYLMFLSCDDDVLFETLPGSYSSSPPKRVKYSNFISSKSYKNKYEVPSLQAICKAKIIKNRIDFSRLNYVCMEYIRERNRRCDVCQQEISEDMFDKVLFTKGIGYTAHILGCVMCPKSH